MGFSSAVDFFDRILAKGSTGSRHGDAAEHRQLVARGWRSCRSPSRVNAHSYLKKRPNINSVDRGTPRRRSSSSSLAHWCWHRRTNPAMIPVTDRGARSPMLDGLSLWQLRFVAEILQRPKRNQSCHRRWVQCENCICCAAAGVRSAVISTATTYLRHVDAANDNRGIAPRRDKGRARPEEDREHRRQNGDANRVAIFLVERRIGDRVEYSLERKLPIPRHAAAVRPRASYPCAVTVFAVAASAGIGKYQLPF